MTKNAKAAGTRRELQEVALRREQGYVAFRSPASLGCADVIAMRLCETFDGDYSEVELIEVKANTGSPWKNFSRDKRAALSAAAKQAGATALLVHHPPGGPRTELPEDVWP